MTWDANLLREPNGQGDNHGTPNGYPEEVPILGSHDSLPNMSTQNEVSKRVGHRRNSLPRNGQADLKVSAGNLPPLVAPLPSRNSLRSTARRVWDYLVNSGFQPNNCRKIAEDLELREKTVYRTLSALAEKGFLEKTKHQDRAFQGLLFRPLVHFEKKKALVGTQIDHPDWVPTSPSIDRQIENKKNLSVYEKVMNLTADEYVALFPTLASLIDFSLRHLQQVAKTRNGIGDQLDGLWESLEYADWELLTYGEFKVGKDGRNVDNPQAYLFRSLARKGGYWRRPTGYVTAQEIALKDQALKLNRELEARKVAEDAAFRLWSYDLTTADKEKMRERYIFNKRSEGVKLNKDHLAMDATWLYDFWQCYIRNGLDKVNE